MKKPIRPVTLSPRKRERKKKKHFKLTREVEIATREELREGPAAYGGTPFGPGHFGGRCAQPPAA